MSSCSELWDFDDKILLLKNDVNVSSSNWGTATLGPWSESSLSTDKPVKKLTINKQFIICHMNELKDISELAK